MSESADADRLAEVERRAAGTLSNMRDFLGGGSSTVNINAGGIGVWAATTCCLVMVAVSLFQGLMYLDMKAELRAHEAEASQKLMSQQDQIRDLNDYLSAIYVMAPQFKPKQEASK